jgi:gamma-carbonic anhydrase
VTDPLPPIHNPGPLILPFRGKVPVIGEEVFIAPNATVVGEVLLGDHVSLWFGAVLRGDIARIEVGEGSNIQDNSVLHVGDEDPCLVGRNVVVGHAAILHGCTVEDDCTIGMGAVILNGAVIGKGSVVGAGALVPPKTVIPPGSLAVGHPAQVIRSLSPKEREHYAIFAPKYIRIAEEYRRLFQAEGNPPFQKP